jgi:hypothetical protein
MIQRTEDIGTIKHQEDSKPLVDQQNIQVQVEQKEDAVKHQVVSKEDSPGTENQADAREEGRGVYYHATGRKHKPKEEEKPADRVIRKQPGGGFDMKV